MAFTGTIAEAQNRIERYFAVVAPLMVSFQTNFFLDIDTEFPGNGRYQQFLMTDPLLEEVMGITGLSIDVYEAPGGHGWTATMTASAEDRYFTRTWDGAGPETHSTGGWIETDVDGVPL